MAIEILIYSYSVSCVFSIEYQLHPGGAAPRSPAGSPAGAGAGEVFHPVTNAGKGAGGKCGARGRSCLTRPCPTPLPGYMGLNLGHGPYIFGKISYIVLKVHKFSYMLLVSSYVSTLQNFLPLYAIHVISQPF